jgi:hypothetical protein
VALETEFAFTLPKGYVDDSGMLHRHGTMRLATARDEIEPLRDPRISGADDPYLTILVISRVVTALGSLRQVTPNEIEGLFAADLAFLQDLYGIINFGDPADAVRLQASVLPPEPEPAPVAPAVAAEAEQSAAIPTSNVDADDAPDDGDPVPSFSRRRHIEEVGTRVQP